MFMLQYANKENYFNKFVLVRFAQNLWIAVLAWILCFWAEGIDWKQCLHSTSILSTFKVT